VATVRETHDAPVVREEAVDMGGLFGIVTEPAEPPAQEPPTILLHNVGANSHIGANRMYVMMARRLAALGFRVLRFDIAGLGDSAADQRLGENQVYSDGTAEDSRRAIDFLARTREARRFVLMGVCSGAFFSFHAALADTRVVGIVLMNVQIFHWQKGAPVDTLNRDVLKSINYYWKAALGTEAWLRLARWEVNVGTIAKGALQEVGKFARHRVERVLLGESDVARGFRALLRRGTDVLLVLSADDAARNVVDAHLGVDARHFRSDPGFRFEIFDGADHTFSPLACQDALLSLLTDHVKARWGGHFWATRPGALRGGGEAANTSR
jgi:pimeloyl-ACP methyl ester carboxylesterase